MAEDSFRYHHRGVSASKDEVHKAIQSLDKGLFPNAFCKVLPDLVGMDKEYCNIMHADTAGTKTSLAYIYWKETGDINIWKGIVEDAIIMNTDDMACVGCIDNIILSSTIGRNKHLISGEVIKVIIEHSQEFLAKLASYGIQMYLAGGETADVGDIVKTIDVGYTTFCRIKRNDIIDIDIMPGDYAVGFSSYGTATYETSYNSGIGSNGLTSARHDLFDKIYRKKYPESFSEQMDEKYAYTGSYLLTDEILVGNESIPMGKLVLSPTRTYMPVIKRILSEYKNAINGIIHCSGGGQTKVSKFIKGNVRIVKDNLLKIPEVFELIKKESESDWEEMYKVFNMGHRLEMYTPSLEVAENMIKMAGEFNIEAQIIGRAISSIDPGVSIISDGYEIHYK
ncbi:MAG: phosphoribosylformylglycinamidine cyclo-ligase [Saprospiraceae bacterium]|nr:phosphoribosylformylglycinamidine cyclo-ligase [Saprospiraceae bacterium]